MAQRATSSLLSAAFFLLSSAAFAQVPAASAPPEVDQALRARVTEFFNDFIAGKFRQAINFVAEDTQDEYFASPKMEMKAFTIDSIAYSENFTNATVMLAVKQVWRMKAEGFMRDEVVDTPMSTTWKIENGQWVWYHHAQTSGWITPMGSSAEIKSSDAPSVPKKFDTATMDQEALKILSQNPAAATGVTPDEVKLTSNNRSAKVVFHNGLPGSVSIDLSGLPDKLPGFTAKLDKREVNAKEEATIEIHYDPPTPDANFIPFSFAVEVQPFGRLIPIQVSYLPSN